MGKRAPSEIRKTPDRAAKVPRSPVPSRVVLISEIEVKEEQVSATDDTPQAYAEVLPLSVQGPVTLFKKRNYKVRLSDEIHHFRINRITSSLGTRAGTDLVSKDFISPKWQHLVKPSRHLGLVEEMK